MLFMVIERFRDNDMVPVYQHLRDKGRGIAQGPGICRQLDRAQFRALLPADALRGSEAVPGMGSALARARRQPGDRAGGAQQGNASGRCAISCCFRHKAQVRGRRTGAWSLPLCRLWLCCRRSWPKAPVAQLDRALPSEGRGREFESRRVRQLNQTLRNLSSSLTPIIAST